VLIDQLAGRLISLANVSERHGTEWLTPELPGRNERDR